jgi:hypothetical protein
MLENLKQLVKDHAQEAIINNSDVPNHLNNDAIEAASSSIFSSLQDQITNGKIEDLVAMFSNNKADIENPTVQIASSNFVQKLHELGIDAESAKNICASLMPSLMGKLVNQTNDPSDSTFNLKDMLSSLTGGDSKFDLSSVLGMFNMGSIADVANVSGNGILGKLKSFFK